MSILLFFIILTGFCWLIPKIPFFQKSGIAPGTIILFFLIRTGMGVFNCFLAYRQVYVYDSLAFHNISLNEYYQLLHNPGYFIRETFNDYGRNYSGVLETYQSFWNNLKTNIIVKFLAVLNIFTFRNFYTNTLLFNIATFFGSFAMFKSFGSVFQNKRILALGVFLFPSALFFTSTIHRDGLVWMLLGFFIYFFSSAEAIRRKYVRYCILTTCLVLIFFIRNYLSFIVLPGLVAWWISVKNVRFTLPVYVIVSVACIFVFFAARYVIPAADFPQFIINKQANFISVVTASGRTNIPPLHLSPDLSGFLKAFPAAVKNGFFIPFIWNIQHPVEIPFALEMLATEILIILWVLKTPKTASPLISFAIFVSIVSIIMIGYTIPNLGAILRYRSIYVQLIFIVLLCSIFSKGSLQKYI